MFFIAIAGMLYIVGAYIQGATIVKALAGDLTNDATINRFIFGAICILSAFGIFVCGAIGFISNELSGIN